MRPDKKLKILIVRVSSLGDVVHNMPMVADILRHYPGAEIDWVVEESYTSLIELNSGVRKVIPFALRRWRKQLFAPATRAEMRKFFHELRRRSYDFVFDTQGLFKTGVVMRMARVTSDGHRVGLANATDGSGYEGISRIFHSMSIPIGKRTHAVERARLVAATALGYRLEGAADFLLRTPVVSDLDWMPSQPYAVFFHGTARAAKKWNTESWGQIGHMLNARGLRILLPWGSEDELETAKAIAARISNAVVLPRLSMMDAVLLAQRAAIVIGVDSGLTHVAAAYCRPTIELYCDSPKWKTEGYWSPNIINLGDQGQTPTVDEAEVAITDLLQKANLGPSSADTA